LSSLCSWGLLRTSMGVGAVEEREKSCSMQVRKHLAERMLLSTSTRHFSKVEKFASVTFCDDERSESRKGLECG